MPLVTRWRRLPISVQWATVCAVLMVVVAALVVALVSLATANGVGRCLNDSLGGERAVTSAQYDAAVADAFDLAGQSITSKAAGQDPAVLKRFLADVATVHAVAAYRKAHPLGNC